jgi:hypothetical protein
VVIVSDGWYLWLLNDYLCVALILRVGPAAYWIFNRSWFYGLILNHVHWIILMWQLHNDPLVVNRWLLPASDPLTILTLICLFHPLLIVRSHWYLPLQHSSRRHDFVVTGGGGVLFLQDYLRAASLPAATSTVRGMVRGWLLLLLVIVNDWGVMGGILTFFLAIWLL